MIGSLFTGISGLSANTSAMAVIGDNIANVNTTGFKSSRASFANILSQSVGGSSEIGRGVMMSGVSPLWSSGSLENTANATDLAVNGKGLFVVNDKAGASYYTRAGNFNFDKDSNLVNPDGLIVQGYKIDDSGTLGAIGNITIPGGGTNPPNATSELTVGLNLDAGADSAIPDKYSTSLTVYDSLGNDIPLTIEFTKNATTPGSEWDVTASIPLTAGTATFVGGTSLKFDEDGKLITAADLTINLALINGATASQDITWDIVDDALVTNGDVTGYASSSVTKSQAQNGYASGILQSVSVDEAGNVTGVYSNGQLKNLYKIALADFPNYSGLEKMGGGLYSESLASGLPVINTAGTGNLGSISSSSLEMSNVDLAAEFTKMITTQRAFQANSRVITTSDEILTELINIKR